MSQKTIRFLDMRTLKPIEHEPLGVVSNDPEGAEQDRYWARIAKVFASGQRVVAVVEVCR